MLKINRWTAAVSFQRLKSNFIDNIVEKEPSQPDIKRNP